MTSLLPFTEYVRAIYFTDEFKAGLYELAGFLCGGGNLGNALVILEVNKVSVDQSVVDVLVAEPSIQKLDRKVSYLHLHCDKEKSRTYE